MREEGYGRSFAPVNVGDEIEVTIEAVGAKGDGIAKKEGFVLFIPNTKEGQLVKVRITKVLRKVGFAEVVGEAEPEAAEEPAPEEATEEAAGEAGPAEEAPVEEPTEEPKKPEEAAEEELPGEVEDTEDFGEEEKTE